MKRIKKVSVPGEGNRILLCSTELTCKFQVTLELAQQLTLSQVIEHKKFKISDSGVS